MSSTTTSARVDIVRTTDSPRFIDVLQSEWTKIRSLRSTWFTLIAMFVVTVGIGVLSAGGAAEDYEQMSAADRADFIPTGDPYFIGSLIGVISIGVLGVLTITGEHGTGMIGTSLSVVPNRTRLLVAKFTAFAAVALAGGLVTAFALFGTSQGVLANLDVPTSSLGDPHVLRATIGVVMYFTVFGLLAVALGTLIRATAGAVVTLIAGALLLPNFFGALPETISEFLRTYWPTSAGLNVVVAGRDPEGLAPWPGLGVMAGFTAVMLATAVLVFRHRDV